MISMFPTSTVVAGVVLVMLVLASPVDAFGAGFVSRGTSNKGTNYRHGDILYAVYFLRHAHSSLVRQIYFGNWLRDFSQLMDRKAMETVPEPILRAIVAIFAYLQFGYTTGEFEVTPERLGFYRPEEHVDNPRGYEGGLYSDLRPAVAPEELAVDPSSGMKNYIANTTAAQHNETSRNYIDRQLISAIACARARDVEAYTHLGAALHALEDFVAHSNWLELCIQMISVELGQETPEVSAMANVFAFTGGAARVSTNRGSVPPLVTGTFGALDLYQTVLGEFDDKLTSLSLPGLQMRMKSPDESLSTASQVLIKIFTDLDNKSLVGDIHTITKAATEQPADWGKLSRAPEVLWDQLYPVFRLRDKIVRWVYDHLTVDAVANAVASISTALDKLVYRILGACLSPILKDLSTAISVQANHLQALDQQVRLARGEESVFEDYSPATDPTHSQLCKDHYDHDLNELAGRVATKITTFTIKKIVEVWQPGTHTDVRPTLDAILDALHHPFNHAKDNEIQSLMVAEVMDWCTTQQREQPEAFTNTMRRLSRTYMAGRQGAETRETIHSHVPSMTAAYANPHQIAGTTAHDLTTVRTGGAHTGFIEKIATNLENCLSQNIFPGLGLDDLPAIKKVLYAAPSAETPNPIDQSLLKIPGAGLVKVFDDDNIDSAEIVAAPGMGIILKDAVIALRLRDLDRVARQQTAAQQRLGTLEDRPVKQLMDLLDFGGKFNNQSKTSSSPLSPSDDQPVGEESGGDVSKTSKLLNKLKIAKRDDDPLLFDS